MDEEFKALMHNRTFTLVLLPQVHKPIGTEWLYKIKLHANSMIDHYKARWVAMGFTQHFSIAYLTTLLSIFVKRRYCPFS